MRKLALFVVVGVLFPASVEAELIKKDWNDWQDRYLAHDTATGLDWLNLWATRELSQAELDDFLADAVSDWRLATLGEVCGLLSQLELSPTGEGQECAGALDPSGDLVPGVVEFQTLLGAPHIEPELLAIIAEGVFAGTPENGLVDVTYWYEGPSGSVTVAEAASPALPYGYLLVREEDPQHTWPAWPRKGPSTRVPWDGDPGYAELGAIPYEDGEGSGVTFRVWAPNSEQVAVLDMDELGDPEGVLDPGAAPGWTTYLSCDPNGELPCESGYWSTDVEGAEVGDQYRYLTAIVFENEPVTRRDPHGWKVTTHDFATGNSIVEDRGSFGWSPEALGFKRPSQQGLVLAPVAGFSTVSDALLDMLQELGFTGILVPPPTEHPNGASPFAVTDPYAVDYDLHGGPQMYLEFIERAHERGLSVVQNIELATWTGGWPAVEEPEHHLLYFDGSYSPEQPRGPYFWDAARLYDKVGVFLVRRPNYSEPEVRRYLTDNLRMWVERYDVDGFRWDSALTISRVPGNESWEWMQDANLELDALGSGPDEGPLFSMGEFLWTPEYRFAVEPVDPELEHRGGLGFDAKYSAWYEMATAVAGPEDPCGWIKGWEDPMPLSRVQSWISKSLGYKDVLFTLDQMGDRQKSECKKGGAEDADNDGICVETDNCSAMPNQDQRDTNADGYGNLCDADFNDDDSVDGSDYILLTSAYGSSQNDPDDPGDDDPNYDADIDMDGDGYIDAADLDSFMSYWGERPGPSGLDCAGIVPCVADEVVVDLCPGSLIRRLVVSFPTCENDPEHFDPICKIARQQHGLFFTLWMTMPGVPMVHPSVPLLQQEKTPIDLGRSQLYPGSYELYQDLLALRHDAKITGLRGENIENVPVVFRGGALVKAFRRFGETPGALWDDVVVLLKFSDDPLSSGVYLPVDKGIWKVVLDTDEEKYGVVCVGHEPGSCPSDYTGVPDGYVVSEDDGHATDVEIAPHSAVILALACIRGGEGDGDDDAICLEADNCSALANPEQLDEDQDGYGNLCDADFNNDGVVNGSDYMLLISAFGSSIGDPGYVPEIDMDSDGYIRASDYDLFLPYWGRPPGPSGRECAGSIPCP